MSESPLPAIRIVPGAPPPAPVTKSQKKKRSKGAKGKSDTDSPVVISTPLDAALVGQAPSETEVKEGVVASELVVQPEEPQQAIEDSAIKLSPIVDLVSKRMKALHKKLVSLSGFSVRFIVTGGHMRVVF